MTTPPERNRRAEEYLDAEHNLDGQQGWYDRKATFNKRWHMRLGFIILASGASVTAVQLWAPNPPEVPVHWTAWVTAGLGILVVVAKGIDRLWSFDENWSTYRQASEAIKRERRLYINLAGPYRGVTDEEVAFKLFVERVEEVIAIENQTFWQQKTSEKGSASPEKAGS